MGLKRSDFDAMTVAAKVDCGAYGKVDECSGLAYRGPIDRQGRRVSGKNIRDRSNRVGSGHKLIDNHGFVEIV